jgi:preprotein translocase subunit SecD
MRNALKILLGILVLIVIFLLVYYFIKYSQSSMCLEFREAQWMSSDKPALTLAEVKETYGEDAYIDSVGVSSFVLTDDLINERPIILKRVFLTGEDIEDVWVGENEAGVPTLNIKFNSSAAKVLQEVTSKTVTDPIALLLNKKVVSAPTIYEPITDGRLEITHDLIDTEDIEGLVEKLRKISK